MAEVGPADKVSQPSESAQSSTKPALTHGAGVTASFDFVKPMSPRKRRRSSKPASIREPRITPPSKNTKIDTSSAQSLQPLTGAAAVADEQRARVDKENSGAKRTSPNPARAALEGLRGGQMVAMSRLDDAPGSEDPLSQPLAEVGVSKDNYNVTTDSRENAQTSPMSTSSNTTLERTPTALAMSNGLAVASPSQMDDAPGDEDEGPHEGSGEERSGGGPFEDENRSNKAFTFPGPLNAQIHRTSSLPQVGFGRDNLSPSTKRHKCPYCNTDFTRHHNLKSHLLTHSQEKPYSCDRCDSRFRRLHDLKRHAKLHTGERPHICPKCDRSFARGDALARHNKGQGGCAGRRESVGSFGGEDRNDESMRASDGESMPGFLYTAEASHEPEHMDEDPESPAGRSLPSIRKHEAPPDPQQRQSDHQNLFHARQPSTYPPVVARPSATGSLYPPAPVASPRASSGTLTTHGSLNHFPPLGGVSSSYQTAAPNVFAAGGGMTESPKPLSPGGMISHQLGQGDPGLHRNRSPTLTQQLQQQQLRRATGNNSSPPMNLPPPHQGNTLSNAPHLPPLHGLTPPESRYTLHSQSNGHGQVHPATSSNLPGPPIGPHSPSYPPGNASSANNSLSSHSTGPHASLDRNSSYAHSSDRLWAYLESLASKVSRLEDEVATLKGQGSAQSSNTR